VIEFRNLNGVSFETMTAAFNEAFSDYDIPAKYTVNYLRALVLRRGYRPDLAVGAFDGEQLVGFVFNCLDGDAAYNSGTGVIPSHRRHGLARKLMQRSFEATRAAGAATYTLEVIETNHRAAALYRDLGMIETRRLHRWSYEPAKRGRFTELANVHPEALAPWFDFAPSWQNSPRSVSRAVEPYVALGDERCTAIMFPSNGDVALLAVDPAHRRQGLGRALLDAAATRCAKPLRILNIDERAEGVNAFLARCGATKTIVQLEMVIALTAAT
jgi:ribosomal protein S18 acetylase RimI-like enzyme